LTTQHVVNYMPKDKKSVTPQATVVETIQHVKLIKDPEQIKLAQEGLLELDGKRILIVRGGDSALVVSQVYQRFSNEKDDTGEAFRMSRNLRGLTHVVKPWNAPRKLTGPEFLSYLNAWFVPTQQIDNAIGSALLILPEVPPLFGALCQQSRYSGMFAGMFEWID
jgi:hypothetical protein